MPAVSEAQRNTMGWALAYKRGKAKNVPKRIREIANGMSEESLRHFAKTKHKGLPEKKNSESEKDAEFLGRMWMKGFIDQYLQSHSR